MCTLQASCRPSKNPTIGMKSYQSKRKMLKYFFFNAESFLGYSYHEKRHVLKKAWQGLSDNWCTQWVKSWGHTKKNHVFNS